MNTGATTGPVIDADTPANDQLSASLSVLHSLFPNKSIDELTTVLQQCNNCSLVAVRVLLGKVCLKEG